MLSDEEQSAFEQSIAQVRGLAARALQQARDAPQAIAFTAQLHRGLDQVARQAATAGPAPVCKAGCTPCCHVRVEATEPEVFRIAQHLTAGPSDTLDRAITRLRQHVTSTEAGVVRQACSLLVDDHCSIYAVRPAACRKAHSLSVLHCAMLAPEIPQNLRLLLDAEALMAGTAQAYRDSRLPASAQELNAALLAALTDTTAQARWYQGESGSLGSGNPRGA